MNAYCSLKRLANKMLSMERGRNVKQRLRRSRALTKETRQALQTKQEMLITHYRD